MGAFAFSNIKPQFRQCHVCFSVRVNTALSLIFFIRFKYRASWCASIFATCSNNTAMSLKPSSRASFAMRAYITVCSKFSPSADDFKLSVVDDKSPPFKILNQIFACSFSLSAVS